MYKLLFIIIFILTSCHTNSINDETIFLTKDPEIIAELKQKETQCLQNNYESCTDIGAELVAGQDVKQNSIKGLAYLDKACNSNYWQDTAACYSIARAYEYGIGIKKNEAKADQYYYLFCEKAIPKTNNEKYYRKLPECKKYFLTK